MQKPPFAPWVFEVAGPILWVLLAVMYVRQCRRAHALTVPALVFIGATSMFWLEWYGDWAAYLLYNPHLHLIHGWNAPLTSGNKPWAVLPAYGWFFGLIYFPLIKGIRAAHERFAGGVPAQTIVLSETDDDRPHAGPSSGVATAVRARSSAAAAVRTRSAPSFALTLLLVGLVFHYLWDLLIEGVATQWGLWTYTRTIGPAIVGGRGAFPLLYPVIPFAIQMSLTMMLIDARRPDGTPTVEAWMRVNHFTGAKRTGMRVLTWVLTMNLTYVLLFIGPITLIRYAFLPASTLVP